MQAKHTEVSADASEAATHPVAIGETASQPKQSMKFFLIPESQEAFLIRPLVAEGSAEPKYRSGRSARPMRRDVEEHVLPTVEWDESLIGQRIRVLVGEHEWAEGVIADFSSSGGSARAHTLRLADGQTMLQTLPDHRVALNVETARDSTDVPNGFAIEPVPPPPGAPANDAAPKAAGAVANSEAVAVKLEAAAEAAPAQPAAEGKPDEESKPEMETKPSADADMTEAALAAAVEAADDAAAEEHGDAANAAAAATGAAAAAPSGEEVAAALASGDATTNTLLYFSALSPTGFRHVRCVEQLLCASGIGSSHAFEAAIYVNGREKNLETCATAREAADKYRVFVADGLARAAAEAAGGAPAAAPKSRGGGGGGGGSGGEARGSAGGRKREVIEYDESCALLLPPPRICHATVRAAAVRAAAAPLLRPPPWHVESPPPPLHACAPTHPRARLTLLRPLQLRQWSAAVCARSSRRVASGQTARSRRTSRPSRDTVAASSSRRSPTARSASSCAFGLPVAAVAGGTNASVDARAVLVDAAAF